MQIDIDATIPYRVIHNKQIHRLICDSILLYQLILMNMNSCKSICRYHRIDQRVWIVTICSIMVYTYIDLHRMVISIISTHINLHISSIECGLNCTYLILYQSLVLSIDVLIHTYRSHIIVCRYRSIVLQVSQPA